MKMAFFWSHCSPPKLFFGRVSVPCRVRKHQSHRARSISSWSRAVIQTDRRRSLSGVQATSLADVPHLVLFAACFLIVWVGQTLWGERFLGDVSSSVWHQETHTGSPLGEWDLVWRLRYGSACQTLDTRWTSRSLSFTRWFQCTGVLRAWVSYYVLLGWV